MLRLKPNLLFKGMMCAGLLTLSSCINLLPGEEEATGEISFDESAMIDTITVGDTLKIVGSVTASGELGLNYRLLNADGDTLNSARTFIFFDTSITERTEEWDLASDEKLIVVTKNGLTNMACGGAYTLALDVGVEGAVVASATYDFYVRGPECDANESIVADVTIKADSLGAQSAVPGSALDLDNFQAQTRTSAAANSEDMDLYFGFRTTSTEPELMTPQRATTFSTLFPSSGANMDSWTVANATPFYKSGLGSDFSNIKSQYQIDALWNHNATIIDRTGVNVGDVFIAKTNLGKTVLLRIDGISGSGTGTVIRISGYN